MGAMPSLSSNSSSSADGDSVFSNAFNFKSNSGSGGNNTVAMVGLIAFVAGFALAKLVK